MICVFVGLDSKRLYDFKMCFIVYKLRQYLKGNCKIALAERSGAEACWLCSNIVEPVSNFVYMY